MTQLPVTRVRTIMRSSADVENVNKEAVFCVAKATEEFLKALSKEILKNARSANTLSYTHVSNVIHNEESYEFLKDIIPQKITVGEYKQIMRRQQQKQNGQGNEIVISSDSEEDL